MSRATYDGLVRFVRAGSDPDIELDPDDLETYEKDVGRVLFEMEPPSQETYEKFMGYGGLSDCLTDMGEEEQNEVISKSAARMNLSPLD